MRIIKKILWVKAHDLLLTCYVSRAVGCCVHPAWHGLHQAVTRSVPVDRGVETFAKTAGVRITIIDFTLSRLTMPSGAIAFCDLAADPELFQGPAGDCQVRRGAGQTQNSKPWTQGACMLLRRHAAINDVPLLVHATALLESREQQASVVTNRVLHDICTCKQRVTHRSAQ